MLISLAELERKQIFYFPPPKESKCVMSILICGLDNRGLSTVTILIAVLFDCTFGECTVMFVC
jgi:hypothetical protein